MTWDFKERKSRAENNKTYWIGCQRTGGQDEAVTREEFDMIAMAWRSLYAEMVKARMDDKTLTSI